jgi:hypothetical protein
MPIATLQDQLQELPPLELGISMIEYAKAKKPSPCKQCYTPIQNGEPRVGDRQPSAFYEGVRDTPRGETPFAFWQHL